MSDSDIHMDPVADGVPSPSKIGYAVVVVLLAFAAWRLWIGAWADALTDIVMAALVWLIENQKRTYWLNGYYRAARSIEEQARDITERED